MDYLKKLRNSWNWFGENDAFWAVNSLPDKRNNRWDKEEFFKTGIDEIEGIIKYLKSINQTYNNKKAMDFGCGVGRLSQALAQHFDEVVGVDISEEMLEKARRYCPNTFNCHFTLNLTLDLKQFESNTFDFIYTNIVLQHIHPKISKKYIKEFLRVLKPQGIAIFQIPEKMAFNLKGMILRIIPNKLSALLFRLKNNCPVAMEMHCISRKEIVELIKNNSGRITNIQSGWDKEGSIWRSTRYFVEKQ